MEATRGPRPEVVIIGGGFGGLSAAKALRHAPVQVTVVDRQNHHLFQPLLYQVATAALSPADIARPIRNILRRQRNATVFLGKVTGVDLSSTKSAERALKSLDRIFSRISEFAAARRPNLYQKACFGNRIKWGLREAGYPEPFVEVATQKLMTYLALASSARPVS